MTKSVELLNRMRDVVQEDIGNRGLRTEPARNLINACPDDFLLACESLAGAAKPGVAIVTGFYIPTAQPPAGETDGPLGAVYLARALIPLSMRVALVTDAFCERALRAGLAACGLQQQVPVITLPAPIAARSMTPEAYSRDVLGRIPFPLTHLLAIERVGPSHTLESLQQQMASGGALGQAYLDFLDAVPPEHQDRCHNMRGRDITDFTSPAHWLFEWADRQTGVTTIGVGDGGNEIGMGKIPWDIIDRNIAGGGLIACRVPTKYLLVCGISNWGAYALAAGIWRLRGLALHPLLADPENERKILRVMMDHGPLVDGVTGRQTMSVDGLAFEDYIRVLPALTTPK
jgi:hypothetical protein